MDELRCPSCSARVSADAEWCSLCYTSLRAAPAPAPAFAQSSVAGAAPAAPAYPVTPDPLTAPLAELTELAYAASAPADPAAAPPARDVDSPQQATPTWPCRRCGDMVPMESDVCPACGAGFLEGQADDLRLPLVGKAADLDSGKKAWIMVGGAIGIIAVFLVIAGILSLLF
ncbi:MAG: hypothetical protein QOI42_227 [Frankiaceae bacterium]|jgi:RNA polymerase subunit RPABC4/transcription elongation factor Spt4|nr:hypothetical protein [Frankiaceae bacterium]